jgi:hypothetical protein
MVQILLSIYGKGPMKINKAPPGINEKDLLEE